MSRVRTRYAANPADRRPGYSGRVAGVAGTCEEIGLDEDADREAILTAFSACTPFGHSLSRGRRFLGWFEGGDKRIPSEWLVPETRHRTGASQ